MQARMFSHPMWNKKTRRHFKPEYYDNTNFNCKRSWNAKEKGFRYNTQDPLFFDYERLYLNGGIQPFIDQLKNKGNTDIPINKRAYVLYHMAKQRKYDPELVKALEMNIVLHRDEHEKTKVKGQEHMTARYAMAAVIGYWRMNCGSAHVLKYWENYMIRSANDLHVQDVVELCQAFRENRTHHRDHMRGMITKHFKKNMLENLWPHEVRYQQRTLYNLMVELEHLEYWDKDIWRRCFDTIQGLKRLNNLTFFAYFHKMMKFLNEEPTSPLFQTLDDDIAKLKEKHYTVNREWRYNFNTAEWRSYQELIDRRENCEQDAVTIGRGKVDQTLIQRAVEAERKMKRLRMAKYSNELFDEIVMEMMKEKRTIMEMMAELDCEDE